VPIPQAELDAIAEAERLAARAARQPQTPADAAPASAAQSAPPPSTPATETPPAQPAPVPPASDPAPANSTFREVPVGGGN
jgi:hypothetical protein